MSPAPQEQKVEEQLDRILKSEDFAASPRLSSLLSFIVNRTLEGRTARLKAFNIANHVFGRDETFDAATDPLVRVQASRLRKAIERYYLTAGSNDQLRISVPKGRYVATFAANEPVRESRPQQTRTEVTDRTIAILKFDTISRNPNHEFYASGITQELAVSLSGFDLFHVIDLTGHEYDTSDALGALLDKVSARFLLRGSVQIGRTKLRVSASLVDSSSGESVWSRNFTCPITPDSVIEIRDDVSRNVAARVADNYGILPRLLAKESSDYSDPTSGDAYEAMLRFHDYNAHLGPERYLWCRQALEHAIESDPDYAAALAALAELCWDNQLLRYAEPYEGIDEAYAYARRAVVADPESQASWYAMAGVRLLRKDRDGAIEAADRVVALSASRPYYIGAAGFIIALAEDWERGLGLMHDAYAMNPLLPTWLHIAPFEYHFFNHEYEDALASAELLGAPGIAWDPLTRLVSLAKLGHKDRATGVFEQLLRDHPDFDSYAKTYIGYLVFSESNTASLYDAYREACELVQS